MRTNLLRSTCYFYNNVCPSRARASASRDGTFKWVVTYCSFVIYLLCSKGPWLTENLIRADVYCEESEFIGQKATRRSRNIRLFRQWNTTHNSMMRSVIFPKPPNKIRAEAFLTRCRDDSISQSATKIRSRVRREREHLAMTLERCLRKNCDLVWSARSHKAGGWTTAGAYLSYYTHNSLFHLDNTRVNKLPIVLCVRLVEVASASRTDTSARVAASADNFLGHYPSRRCHVPSDDLSILCTAKITPVDFKRRIPKDTCCYKLLYVYTWHASVIVVVCVNVTVWLLMKCYHHDVRRGRDETTRRRRPSVE